MTSDAATLTTAGGAGFVLFGQAVNDPAVYNGGLWVSLIGLAFLVVRTLAEYLASRRLHSQEKITALYRIVAEREAEIAALRSRIGSPPPPITLCPECDRGSSNDR